MRVRMSVLFALLLAFATIVPAAQAAPVVLAQIESEEGVDVENEGGDQADEGTDTGEGADNSEGGDDLGEGGEGEPDAETGAGEDEQAEAVEEEGPQWTYQMSKIVLVMLLLLMLALGALYYKMIAKRQRGV